MSSEIDESDAKADVLGIFLEELQDAADPESVLNRFVTIYPQWARDFVEETVVSRMLVTSRAESTFPDLSKLTDFRILRWVAAGGMGVVYEAEQISLRRRVALKVRHGHSSPEREERFLREQHTLARLHQSHIVPIYFSGKCGFWQFFVMAYIEGVTLHQLIKSARQSVAANRPLPRFGELVRQAVERDKCSTEASRLADFASEISQSVHLSHREDGTCVTAEVPKPVAAPLRALLPIEFFRSAAMLMADAADAIEHAHRADVIHRDIKPSNIMVDVAGQCWLIDFGLADHAEAVQIDATKADKATSRESRSGGTAGTPGYMAPEQVHDAAMVGWVVDFRTDVWGLGATLFELVTLQRPFHGATPQELCASVLTQPLPALDALVRNIPADLRAICRKALHKEPDHRYQRAGDLAADLRRWLDGMPTTALPASTARTALLWARRNKGWTAALLTGFLLLAAVGVILIFDARSKARQSELAREAAEVQVREEHQRIRLHERESLIHEIQRLRLADQKNGWSDQAWQLVQQAGETHSDDRLRDVAAATLLGLDAQLIWHLRVGGSSIAFDAEEQHLLIGGLDEADRKPIHSAALWDMDGKTRIESPLKGEGPVAFTAKGTPLQLVFQHPHLVLWDIARKQSVRKFTLPRADKDAVAKCAPVMALGDSGSLVAASIDFDDKKGRTIVWKAASGESVLTLDEYAEVLAFTSQGDLLATADPYAHKVIVRSIDTGERVLSIAAGNLPVRSLAFGVASRRPVNPIKGRAPQLLAVGDSGGSIAIWDLSTGMPITFCRGSLRDIYTMAFSPDGSLLASSGRHEVQLWEVATGRANLRLLSNHGMDYATQLVFSPSGSRLALTCRGVYYAPNTVIWDLTPNRGMHRLLGLSGQIETIVVSPDGKSVAALAQNWEVGLWDMETGRLRAVFEVPPGEFTDNAALAFSGDGRQLAFAASNSTRGAARLWDAFTAEELHRWELPPGLQNRLAFQGADRLWHFQVEIENGSALPVSSYHWREHPRVCRIRDLKQPESKRVLAENRDFNCHVYRAIATPDGRFVVVDGKGGESGDRRRIEIIEISNGKATWTFEAAQPLGDANLVLDAGGAVVSFNSTNDDRPIQLSIPEGTILRQLPALPAATCRKSNLTAYISWQESRGCSIFRDDELKPIVNLALDQMPTTATFDSTGRRVVWGARDGSVVVCNLPTLRTRLQAIDLGW